MDEAEAVGAGWPTPEWLGRVPYVRALDAQRARRDAIVDGRAAEAVWLLEHDPVVTTGRRDPGLVEAEIPYPVVRTERGGLATYHGPGQLVGYLLLDVGRRGLGVRATVAAIEAGVIGWLADRGVAARCSAGRPGVWVDGAKVCAVGLHFRRGVTMHGFALNLTVDPQAYVGFVPCGIAGATVTSLAQVAGRSPAPEEAAAEVGARVVAALDRAIRARCGADR